MNKAGYFRTNLNGKLRYESFVPTKLKGLEIEKSEILYKKVNEINENIHKLNNCYLTLNAYKKRKIKNSLINIEMKYSTNITYNDYFIENKTFSNFTNIMLTKDSTDKNEKNIDKINLIKSFNYGLSELKRIPISGKLLKNIHYLALNSSKYENKYIGEFRTTTTWMGKENSTLNGANFVFPNYDDMIESFSDLEKYINDIEDTTNVFIKAALIHYQFEVIHPFIDGNGRIGRILTLLYLNEYTNIKVPIILISKALIESNKYYTKIATVELNGYYEIWVEYFMDIINKAIQFTIEVIKEELKK